MIIKKPKKSSFVIKIFAFGCGVLLFIGFFIFKKLEFRRLRLIREREAEELKNKYVLQIMRNSLKGFVYELTADEVCQYKQIFRTSKYAANVYLMMIELSENGKVDMPNDLNLRAEFFEYLMIIRFVNPWGWQLREKRKYFKRGVFHETE